MSDLLALMRWRGRMLSFGKGGKAVLGAILVASGLLILFGLDKAIETALLRVLPQFMADWNGRF